MKPAKFSTIAIFVVVLLLLPACGIRVELGNPTPEGAVPEAEGPENAPRLNVSAEEILLKRMTPVGVLLTDEGSQTLNLVSPQGALLSSVALPGFGAGDPRSLHLAGGWGEGAPLPPVVYLAWQPEQGIMQALEGSAAMLRPLNAFVGMAGAAGQAAFAFSDMRYEQDSVTARLFAGTADAIGSAAPFYELQGSQMGMALLPVAVEAAGGQPQGVWYIQTAWGIGGADLIYPINRGLYFFDLTSGENRMALDHSKNFQGLSPDRRLAASVEFDSQSGAPLTIHHLQSGQSLEFAANPATDRGAGYVVFSPDGKVAAWMEADGSLTGDPPFHPRVRVGHTDSGSILAEVEKEPIAQTLGWETLSWMKPVGFLNSDTLLIEARGSNWNNVAVVIWTLSDLAAKPLGEGSFSGFAYP